MEMQVEFESLAQWIIGIRPLHRSFSFPLVLSRSNLYRPYGYPTRTNGNRNA
jgi:hypothetical protein